MDILHNPDNDSYGFRVTIFESTLTQSMFLNRKHPALEEVTRIRNFIQDQGWTEDQWYELMIPRYDGNKSYVTFDFWFETRNMAVITRLSA